MFSVLGKNDRYLILTAQLYDAKEMAAEAKTKGDKAAQRTAQDRIRVIQQGERAGHPTVARVSLPSARGERVLSSRNEAAGGPPRV